MTFNPRSDDEAAQAITRVVDGNLGESERDAVESWADGGPRDRTPGRPPAPGGARARRRRTAAAGRPDRVDRGALPRPRARVDPGAGEERSANRRAPRAEPASPEPTRQWFAPAGALGALAAVVLAVVVVVGGSGTAPSIDAAAKLAFVPATSPAPRVSSAHLPRRRLPRSHLPQLREAGRGRDRPADQQDRRAARADRLLPPQQRHAISYTVFSGKPVPRPAAAKAVRYEGFRCTSTGCAMDSASSRSSASAAPACWPHALPRMSCSASPPSRSSTQDPPDRPPVPGRGRRHRDTTYCEKGRSWRSPPRAVAGRLRLSERGARQFRRARICPQFA